MKIILYVFLALCLFFIGVPIFLAILHYALVSAQEWARRYRKEQHDNLIFQHLEQCKKCTYAGWIYDKDRPTGDDARYFSGAQYGVSCHYGCHGPFDKNFIDDPGEICKHFEEMETDHA